MEQKAFCQALLQFRSEPQKTKKFLTDKRMTVLERTILECYYLFRDNRNKDVISKLSALATGPSSFVEAQRHLLLGIAHNNLSLLKEAEEHLQRAFPEFMRNSDFEYFYNLTVYNLFTVYLNGKNGPGMKKMLGLLKQRKIKGPEDQLDVLTCEFCYSSFSGDLDRAESVLEEIELLKGHMTERDAIAHLVIVSMFYVKQEKFEECYGLLEDMKKHRKFHLTEVYNYIKKLLDHYTKASPLYLTDAEFAGSPMMFHQLKVIQGLDSGDRAQAEKHWEELRRTDAANYLDEFQFLGDKSLFSLCLQKHLSKTRAIVAELPVKEGQGQVEKLRAFFQTNHAPVLKEDLYEFIWGVRPDSKDDLLRLARIIYLLKQKYGVVVKSRKGSYVVESTKVG